MSKLIFNPGVNDTFPINYNQENYPRKKIEHFSYFLIDNIGKGYSSQVYKGRNDLTNQNVAIKVIDMKMLKNQVHQNLLASEIMCLKKLKRSPNIIDLIEVYTTKNNTYLITELCDNGDLSSMIKNKRLSQKQCIHLMEKIIKGYLEIYRKGVIHRDLKPANILLKGNDLKIADFGFSIKIQDYKKNSSYNVGSPLYMPPQAILQNKYSYKSDIWALGVIFFQMLTGRAPWKARNQKELANKILNSQIKDLLPSQLSQSSINFFMKTLNPNIVFRMSPQQLQNYNLNEQFTKKLIDSKVQKEQSFMKQRKVYSVHQKITKPNVTLPSIFNQNTQIKKDRSSNNDKQTAKQILSYVHFCRFLFKLISRIQSYNIIDAQQLKYQLTSMIYSKINLLNGLQKNNALSLDNFQEFKESSDFQRILNIVKQYEIKYRESLSKFGYGSANQDYKISIKEITYTIKKLYSELEYISAQQTGTFQNKIIILDYLITTFQLITLDSYKNIKQFSNKSKIQKIVDGTTNLITFNHFKAIKDKLKALNFI